MRALAEFIMRGRAQSALIAILLIPLIPQATVALVTLRKGAWEGLGLALWASLPTVFMLWGDREILPLAIAGIVPLLIAYIGANILRTYGSWALAVVCLSAAGLVVGVIYLNFFDAQITTLLEQWVELQKSALEARGMQYDESFMVLPPNRDFVGIGSLALVINGLLALVIGRWWQALLYNPGGFRQEFRELRLNPSFAIVCTLVTGFCLVIPEYRMWSLLSALPLVLVSVSVAHQFAATQRMGITWLVIFYIAMANLPFYLAIALFGLLDSWTDLRGRLLPKPAPSQQRSKNDE